MTSGQKTFLAIITSLCPQVNTSRPSPVLKVEEVILVGKSLDKASSLDHYRLVDVDHLRLVASPPPPPQAGSGSIAPVYSGYYDNHYTPGTTLSGRVIQIKKSQFS
ncbi:hypothetical protein PDE_01535 [Penicillium oxalicum 114-2]|uniref:Uncharacterized protein n=1 Tax=Penicillium oxalicum (strain 114-2 / CGMCC 5302) TaxID=933388 RepID=S8AL59_PENO1|nr:hypothetical protein PDE_01535 [Penicillium oxalicum 114-2]